MTRFLDKKDYVIKYYGSILKGKKDLVTKACCCSDELVTPEIKNIERMLDNEILTRFYGCGSPIPPALEGCTILDLGCGTGKDVFIASKLAGPQGFVIGIDMSDEQLRVAERHLRPQMKRFGFTRTNVEFRKGDIEDLKTVGIEDKTVDVVMSNCVINLSTDKQKVFSEIFRVLKPGGEFFFSDVFTGRRVPDHLRSDPLLYSECLGGALYFEDFRRMLREAGCLDHRITARHKIKLENSPIGARAGMVDFYSVTIRTFKLDSLEDICEDYGQVAVYQGTIPGHPHTFELDNHHRFIAGKPMLVCGNTSSMLSETRYAQHFTIFGDRATHYGPFNCSPAHSKGEGEAEDGGACC